MSVGPPFIGWARAASPVTRTQLALLSRTDTMPLATLFAAVAAFLSAIGLYGVLAYFVGQRAHEIGIRLAVGSTPRAIVRPSAHRGSRVPPSLFSKGA